MTITISFTFKVGSAVPCQGATPAPLPRQSERPETRGFWRQLLFAFMEDDGDQD